MTPNKHSAPSPHLVTLAPRLINYLIPDSSWCFERLQRNSRGMRTNPHRGAPAHRAAVLPDLDPIRSLSGFPLLLIDLEFPSEPSAH